MKRSTRAVILAVILAATAGVAVAEPPAPVAVHSITGRVVRVADGDTITVLDGTNGQHRVRLAHIDAPEKRQPFGTAARNHLAGMVTNGTVRVTFAGRDRYGRIIGTVFAGDRESNLAMVADGFAWHYTQFSNAPEYAAAERAARDRRIGLWRDERPVPPWTWRKERRTGSAVKGTGTVKGGEPGTVK